jgi:pimeloyl-ACP methyl ester carboxylesterase
MVIVGTKDAMLAGAKQVHAAIPGAALVELDGAGHLSNLDQPEAFNRALEDFLGRPPE